MRFKIGEQVSFLYETGEGKIVHIESSSKIIVVDETGFQRPFLENELVKIHGSQNDVYNGLTGFIPNEEDQATSMASNGVEKRKNFWEIDLHTHELISTERGLSSSDLLRIQLNEFRAFYRQAREKLIKKLVVIHGVGEGVLKDEVRSFLSNQEGVSFFDADYKDYGKGATEINIIYNFKPNRF